MESKILKPVQNNKLKTASDVANALVNHAKLKSEQLIIEANRHASLLAKQAEQDGLEKGQRKAFASMISGESMLSEVVENSKLTIIEIALEVAREVLMQEISINPRSILPRVENLMHKALSARKIKIYVHPSISDEVKQRLDQHHEPDKIEVCNDEKLELADVRVVTEIGEITSKLEPELGEISRALMANTSRIFR